MKIINTTLDDIDVALLGTKNDEETEEAIREIVEERIRKIADDLIGIENFQPRQERGH